MRNTMSDQRSCTLLFYSHKLAQPEPSRSQSSRSHHATPLVTRTHWHDLGLRELNTSDVEARPERRSMRRGEHEPHAEMLEGYCKNQMTSKPIWSTM